MVVLGPPIRQMMWATYCGMIESLFWCFEKRVGMERIYYKMIAILGALILLLTACAQSTEAQWQEQYDLGVRYLSEGNYEEAIIAFAAAIEIDPNRAEAYVGRGDAYVGSGEIGDNLDAALVDYTTAAELDETIPAAWLGMANIYIHRGQYDQALNILQEALEKTGNNQSISDKIDEIVNMNTESSANSDTDFEDSVTLEEIVPPGEGLLIRKNWYNEDGLWNYTEYFYNALGICLEEKTTLYDGKIQEHIKYDIHGNEIWHLSYDDITEYQNFYDEEGRLIRQETGLATTYYYYDESGQTVRHESDSTHGVDEYDENGNLIFEEWSWNDDIDREYAGLLINRYYHEYNEDGLLTKTIWPEITEGIWRPHEGWERTYEYECNAAGAPIKRFEYENGQKTSDWWEYIYS